MSGPIPAGSPEVTTIRGRIADARLLQLVFDVGFVTQSAQPQLSLLVRLALAQLREGALLTQFVGAVELAFAQQLHDVPTKLRAKRLADLIHLQGLQGLFELRHKSARPGPAQITTLDCRARVFRGRLGNRAKESLLVDFINQTDLDQIGDKASVIDAFFSFAQAEQQREAAELIDSENLNAEAARRYITASLKREFASDNGTELNAVLPKMSPLNPQYLTKKQSVFQQVAAFVEKFKGVGGRV